MSKTPRMDELLRRCEINAKADPDNLAVAISVAMLNEFQGDESIEKFFEKENMPKDFQAD